MIRLTVAALLGLTAIVAILLVMTQHPFPASTFEFGNEKQFEGVVHTRPYPLLTNGQASYLLTAPGKHGAESLVQGDDGQRVRLRGSLIYRDQAKMIEVAPGTVATLAGGGSSLPPEDSGEVTLTGEIVDSKCYLGVMNPGEGKVHRECAVRCISGGIAPMLISRASSGEWRRILLTGADGRRLNHELLDYVAEPVRLRGHLARIDGWLTLRTEPSTFVRLE